MYLFEVTMECQLCLLKSAALAVINKPSDLYLMAVFLIASMLRLRGQPVFIHIALCNVFWIATALYEAEMYWLMCFISASYVFQYYYDQKSVAAIPSFALAAITLIMGCGTIFGYLGLYGFYDSLFNSYEVYITGIYVTILLSLIDWRRLLSSLGDIIDNVRIGQSGVNRLSGLL